MWAIKYVNVKCSNISQTATLFNNLYSVLNKNFTSAACLSRQYPQRISMDYQWLDISFAGGENYMSALETSKILL